MWFILTHIPHLLPVVIGVAFLIKFGLYAMRLPPPHLSDEELVVWRAEQAAKYRPPRPVSAPVSKLGVGVLPLLVAAFATGLVIYTIDLRGQRPSAMLIWSHSAVSLAALALVSWKLARLPRGRLRAGLNPRGAIGEGASLMLAATSVPLMLTGAVLVLAPSSSGFMAYAHLIASVWWTALLQWHLYRYFRRALRAALGHGSPRLGRQRA